MTFRARLLIKLAWLSNLSRYDWRQAVPYVARGAHSGVPACCIAFYVLEYLPWLNTVGTPHPYQAELRLAGLHREKTEEELRLWMAGLAESDPPPHYVPCPDCLAAGRFVELHECTPECAGQPGGTPPIPLELERRRRVAEAKAKASKIQSEADEKSGETTTNGEATHPGYYTRSQARQALDITEHDMRWLCAVGRMVSDDVSSQGYTLYSEAQIQMLLHRKKDGSLMRTGDEVVDHGGS